GSCRIPSSRSAASCGARIAMLRSLVCSGPAQVCRSAEPHGVRSRGGAQPRTSRATPASEAGWPDQVPSPVSPTSGANASPGSRGAICARRRTKDSSMSNILVINASGQETRVALIEQGTISEYYLERKNEKGIVGNIYKGRVVRVLPGMQAAFVDIGLEKAAFLYVADIVSDPSFPGFSEEIEMQAGATEGDPLEMDDIAEPAEDAAAAAVPAAAPAPLEDPARALPGEQTAAGTASAQAPVSAPEPE